jgi:hypothetical protein
MKTRTAEWFFWFFRVIACVSILGVGLYGCGGESVTVIGQAPGINPPPVEKHEILFILNASEVKLAMNGSQVIHLVQNGMETTLDTATDNVLKIVWLGNKAGWTTGIGAPYTPPITFVSGLFDSDTGIFGIITESNSLYFLNINHINVSGNGVLVSVDNVAGLITYARQ